MVSRVNYENRKSSILVNEKYIDYENESDEESYKRALRKIDIRMILLYSLAYTCTQINKSNISSTAVLNISEGTNIKKQLGNLTSAQWAWCISVFYYPYMFFEPPFTLLAKKVGPKVWQARIMISWGIVSMLQATAFNYSSMIAARFFLGLLEASWYTTVLYHMSFFYKPRELPKRIAFFYSFGMLSGAFSGLLAYGISFMNGIGGLSGWKWIFIFEGLPTIFLGVLIWFILPNYLEDAKFLTEKEKEIILQNHPETAPKRLDKAFNWDRIKELLKSTTFYTYTCIWVFQGVGGWGISFVLPSIVYDLGFTTTAQTQLMQLPPSLFGFFLLNILGQLVHHRYFSSFLVASILSVVQVTCYIVLLTCNNTTAKYMMLVFATGISNSLFPIMWSDRIRVVKGTSSSALAIGFTNGSTQLMGILGPQIYQSKFGPTYHVSYACSVVLCSMATVFILVTWYLVFKYKLIDTEGADPDSSSDKVSCDSVECCKKE